MYRMNGVNKSKTSTDTFSQYVKDNDVLNGCIGGLVLESQSHKK